MTRVNFLLSDGLDPQLCEHLPVTVLNSDMERVTEVSDLAAGSYVAQAILPSGEPATAAFTVPQDGAATLTIELRRLVDLGLPPAAGRAGAWDASGAGAAAIGELIASIPGIPFLSGLMQTFPFVQQRARRAAVSTALQLQEQRSGGLSGLRFEAAPGRDVAAKIRLLNRRMDAITSAESVSEILAGSQPKVLDAGCILQFAQPRRPLWHIILPVSGAEPVTLEFRSHETGWFPHVRLSDPRAELVLQYAVSQQASEFAQLAGKGGELAASGLDDGAKRPILAVLGGYAQLRIGGLDEAGDIAARLIEARPDLPDGHILAGEHCARLGRHDEAAGHFLDSIPLGRPLARLGLRFLIDRLSSYVAAQHSEDSKTRDAITANADQLRSAQEDIVKFAELVDFDRLLLTYSGEQRLPMTAGEFREFPGEGINLDLTPVNRTPPPRPGPLEPEPTPAK